MAASVAMPDNMYCEACQMHLNGPDHWEEHRKGKTHKEKVATKNAREQQPPTTESVTPTNVRS